LLNQLLDKSILYESSGFLPCRLRHFVFERSSFIEAKKACLMDQPEKL